MFLCVSCHSVKFVFLQMEGVGSADIDDSYPPSSQMYLSIGDSNPPEGAGSADTQQEEGHQGDSSSALSQQAAPQQSSQPRSTPHRPGQPEQDRTVSSTEEKKQQLLQMTDSLTSPAANEQSDAKPEVKKPVPLKPEESIDDSYPPSSQMCLSTDDSYPPSSQMCLSIGDSNPPEGAGSAYTQQEEGHQGDSSSALSQQAAPQQSQCYTPGWSPPPSEAPSAESGDDSPTDLNQSTPDLNQSLDLNQSFDLNKFKNTNFDAIVDYTLNAPENEPLSSLESSQSNVEDTEGRSPRIPIMYQDVAPTSDPEEEEEEEEYLKERERKRSRKQSTHNETPAIEPFIPQSNKSLDRQNKWATAFSKSEDDDDDNGDVDYDPNEDKKEKRTKFKSNMGFSSDSNTESDEEEGPEKKKKKKSDESYENRIKSVLSLLGNDQAKEDNSLKISKELFGGNKNRKRPSPRNQDEEENQPNYQMNSDDEEDSKKKKTNKTFATDYPKVYQIEVVPKSSGKDETHNKQHLCVFCSDSHFTNFAKHVIDMHPEEDEVQYIKTLEKGSPKRAQMIFLLMARGNHDMNMKTLKAGEGMFVPNRRVSPGKPWRVADYSPCPHCHVWLLQRILWKHQKRCSALVNNNRKEISQLPPLRERELALESDIVAGRVSVHADEKLKEEVFKNMRNDWITKVARADPLICCLGNLSMKRNIGNKVMRKYTVSSVMRLAARCLIELRALRPDEEGQKNLTWYQALVPEGYDDMVKAVFAVCRESFIEGLVEDEDVDEDDLEAPSNAIKLSYDIGRLCSIKCSMAIDLKDHVQGEKERKNVKRFIDKFRFNWSTDVKKRARHVLRERKLNTTVELPDPNDIAIFAEFMQKKMEQARKPCSYDEFKETQHDVLARMIVFNRRLPGEVQALK